MPGSPAQLGHLEAGEEDLNDNVGPGKSPVRARAGGGGQSSPQRPCRWELCSFTASEESIQGDPRVGSCGVMRLEGCPQVSKVSSLLLLLWKKASFVFIGARRKTNVHRLCALGPRRLAGPRGCYRTHRAGTGCSERERDRRDSLLAGSALCWAGEGSGSFST